MTRFPPFRNLYSVMVVTLHVAVIASVVRSFLRPTSLAGSFAVWVPLSILAALFLSMPIGHAIASAFQPVAVQYTRTCPRCARGELRPLLRSGAGLFTPITGYRCASCRTTFRRVGESVIEEPAPDQSGPAEPEGILFLAAPPADEPGIRFLDEPAPANIPARPVSGV